MDQGCALLFLDFRTVGVQVDNLMVTEASWVLADPVTLKHGDVQTTGITNTGAPPPYVPGGIGGWSSNSDGIGVDKLGPMIDLYISSTVSEWTCVLPAGRGISILERRYIQLHYPELDRRLRQESLDLTTLGYSISMARREIPKIGLSPEPPSSTATVELEIQLYREFLQILGRTGR